MAGVLAISTSAHSTWLWAADEADADAVRGALDAQNLCWAPARRCGRDVPNVTDVESGITAADACVALAAAGWRFRWHSGTGAHEPRFDAS